jgi:glutamine synthetase
MIVPEGQHMAHFDTSGLQPAAERLAAQGIDVVRLGYADIIGTDRSRDVLVNRFPRTVGGGVAFCRSVYGTTPRGGVVDIQGGLSDGLPDLLAFPDLGTLLPVPWEDGVAHCIGDLYNPDGSPSQESPRYVLRQIVEQFMTSRCSRPLARSWSSTSSRRTSPPPVAGSGTARGPATCMCRV